MHKETNIPVHDVRKYGAIGDGRSNDTAAIQVAVDACAGSGGTVMLSGGVFACGQVELKDHMTFYIDYDAMLLGINGVTYEEAISHYPVRIPDYETRTTIYCRRSILYAIGADDLIVCGGGTIDGQGGEQLWAPDPRNEKYKEGERPMLLRFFRCSKLTVKGIKLKNSAMWAQVYDQCTGVQIENTHVDTCVNHSDGLNINDSNDVLIQNNYVSSDDDAIVLKSCCPVGLDNVVIRNNTVRSDRCAAFEIGRDTQGPITNIQWINNKGLEGNHDGGFIFDVKDGSKIDGMVIDNHQNPFGIHMKITNRDLGDLGRIGSIKNVTISNACELNRILNCKLQGLNADGTIENIIFKNCVLSTQPDKNRFVHNVIFDC